MQEALELITFFTVSDTEARAWTLRSGQSALDVAATIHTDMARGFIRAECYRIEDLETHKSEKAIRAAGKLRSEGKNYRIHDGDVMRVLFRV